MSSFLRKLNIFAATPTPEMIRPVLLAITGVMPAMVESILSEKGHVLITLQINPAHARDMETVADQAEQRILQLPGVISARIILTAERPATPDHAPAIKMGGKPETKIDRPLAPDVKHIIAVASGKGGVGKSTVAVNLAVALAQTGLQVGLLDADIYGPSVPTMLGLAGQKPAQAPGADGGEYLIPLEAHGLKIMSMGSLVGDNAPMIWRGPMVQSAIQQMLRDVQWGALDILVLDMPPGTGDAQLTVAQKVPLKGAVIVSTPQDIAWLDAAKGIAMFRKVGVPILGVVENMSQFCCPNCGTISPIFGESHITERLQALDVPFLGDLPLQADIRAQSDAGLPIILADSDGEVAKRFDLIAQEVIKTLSPV